MKKINQLISLLFFLIVMHGCSGYEPIFSSKDVKFIISNYSINGDKILGNKIYSKLKKISKSNKDNTDTTRIDLFINVTKDKISTSKDSSGKILEYKIVLNTQIEVNDTANDSKILNQDFKNSSTYKIQNQYSDTINLENQIVETLIDKTYQELLIELSQNILNK